MRALPWLAACCFVLITTPVVADNSGVDRLKDQLAKLGARARTHEHEIHEYNDGCRSGTGVTTDTGTGVIDNATTPECRIRASRFVAEEHAIRDDLAAAKEAARRAAVSPGTVRDAIKRNGLANSANEAAQPAVGQFDAWACGRRGGESRGIRRGAGPISAPAV